MAKKTIFAPLNNELLKKGVLPVSSNISVEMGVKDLHLGMLTKEDKP